MKKTLIFTLGIITGVFLTFVGLFIVGINKSNNNGITMFEEPGEVIMADQFKIFQVLEPHVALANAEDSSLSLSSISFFNGPIVLFVNHTGKYYYDDEIIKVPQGKCVRQIGIYNYMNRTGGVKTVPVVCMMDI
ncbi:MAG: hypothetical protein K2H81_01455 [Alistipes sp.]|nr:hypothetical protein [Alistipes sp.]